MSDDEAMTTEIVKSAQPDMSIALVEAETRAKIMKAILPQLVAVCHAKNIMAMKDGDGGARPYITNDGCQKIARIAGISFGKPEVTVSYEDLPPEPEERWEDSGKVKKHARPARRAYIVEVQGEASLLGQTITEFGGASSEDGFYNRPKESPVEIRLEVRKKAMANWQGRCVRSLLGLQGLSWDDLKKVGYNPDESDSIEYKKGRYSSQKDTSDDQAAADETRTKIREQILADVAGNNEAACELLEMVTEFTGKDGSQVAGVRNAAKLSDRRAATTWGRIKPGGGDRENYQKMVVDVNDKYGLWDKEASE